MSVPRIKSTTKLDLLRNNKHLEAVMAALSKAHLTLNKDKCQFRKTSVEYLGFNVGSGGYRPTGEKVDAILKFPTPQSVSNVGTFLGMANYYRRFIRNFSDVAEPLTQLTRTKRQFQWENSQQVAFEKLRTAMAACSWLNFPN